MADALERLTETYEDGEVDFIDQESKDIRAVCKELRAAREAVEIVEADVFELPAAEVKKWIGEKMKEARNNP